MHFHKTKQRKQGFLLSQVVSGHTHTSTTDSESLINLVLVSDPSLLHSCLVIPPLANSDHYGTHYHQGRRPTTALVKCGAMPMQIFQRQAS